MNSHGLLYLKAKNIHIETFAIYIKEKIAAK